MTEDRLPLAELLAKAGDGDFLRSVAEAVVQLPMETDVEGLIGAGRHERSGERTTHRNISGSTPPTSSSVRAGASCRSPR
jgi:transposase-like protein